MFFIMGIAPRNKQLNYNNSLFICDKCGQYGRYEVFMTCMCLSLFFIPVLKWKKQYIVRTTCCDSHYELETEIGQAIAKGNEVEIKAEYLRPLGNTTQSSYKRCTQCGFTTIEEFRYCPNCGKQFDN